MELNFCPFCDAPQHKVLNYKDKLLFCKECNRFFNLQEVTLSCPKCKSNNIAHSDFPSPNGELVLQCKKCKKMYTAKEFLEANKID